MTRPLSTLAWIALAALACFGHGIAGPSVRYRPADPRPVAKLKPGPHGLTVDGGALIRYADGSGGLRLSLGRHHVLQARSVRHSGDSEGKIVVSFSGGGADERWEFDRGLLDRFARAGSYAIATYGPHHTPAELGSAMRHELDPWELQALESLDRRIRETVDVNDIVAALQATSRYLLDSGDDCYGKLGGTFLRLGGSIACWAAVPATFGLSSVACLGASVITLSAAVDAWDACVGPCPGCGGGDPDPGLPDCDDPDLEPGDSCICYCPGEVCCDWPEG